ncbi:aminodeoxychorismate lyase [Gordonia sp. (in: high G+C Gram-positive bacteria)]|uniref:aminodeoxychorismate lyase n=1 Tax=Gordonia sp. (in: high G+C Gram-positive bacteria) TaxID=84139 RepID=UPI0026194E74|nr:aminodeoxychorismate lyase [Gordonia sp. (in: high G+C Gram-positive bacteria)]
MTMFVVTGDGRVHDAARPLLHADDLAALRGDGVFETLLIRGGRARLLDAHLDRLADGAVALDLPAPDRMALRRAVAVAEEEWGRRAGGAPEAMLRIVYARGRESTPGGPPTCYLTVAPVPARVAVARRDGIAVLTLDRGLDPRAAALPWVLAGIKALAYAGNTAALRYAQERGADDAIFTGAAGTVLEGPRSSVVVQTAGRLVTPPRSGPILPGTTQAALFAVARERGLLAREEELTVDDLRAADGVWLLSSVTLAARVHTLDGRPLPDRAVRLDVAGLVDAALDRGTDS